VPRGYAVINADLRGFGHSEGIGTFLSDEEAADYAELIAWSAAQPWSTGKVGLNGVSYLALSQWKVAALRPPALAAICPWEGWSDIYRDVAYPGGVREDGFVPFWANMTERAGRVRESFRAQQLAHPEWDAFWESRVPQLEQIEAPALICASFSDQGLHSRGCFEAFRRIGSAHRFLYTHRGGKWSTYYSEEALALQARFFDCFLKGANNGMSEAAPVRLEVRSTGRMVHDVRHERAWPPPDTKWTKLYLAAGALAVSLPSPATLRFDAARGSASFVYVVPDDLELVGPMTLRLVVALEAAEDASLFAAVRKFVGESEIPFEGPFGFGRDVVSRGWLRVRKQATGPVEIALLPSATFFRRGERLRLDVQGHWFWRRSMFFGMFPGDYQASQRGTIVLHLGGDHDAHLVVPITR
jgi:predicted acyl esterase